MQTYNCDCNEELEEKIEAIKTFVQNSKETREIEIIENFINDRGDTLEETTIEL